MLRICPLCSSGGSTGFAPIHVRSVAVAASVQNFTFLVGSVFDVCFFFLFVIGTSRIRIDMTRAMTPPSFDGIERRIA